MAVVTKSPKDYKALYNGFDKMEVGLGTIEPNIYATKDYQKKKTDRILIGGLQEIRYVGAEHDLSPLILVIGYETVYNTILAYNLHYIPEKYRIAIVNLVLKSNFARIKGQKPIIVDYHMIKRAIPESARIVRRYKVVGIKVVDQYPLVEWTKAIKKKNRWQNWYKKNQTKKADKIVNGFIRRKKKNK